MSILRPFQLARAVLGVSDDADATAIKRAYRKLTLAHPPDTDPEGFRRLRDAYELLSDPWRAADERLLDPRPAIDPPPLLPPEPIDAGELALAILREAAARIDPASLLPPAPAAAPDAAGLHDRKSPS